MITVKGFYENGVVKILEKPPVSGAQKVLITFIGEPEEEEIRSLTLGQQTGFLKQYLEDEREDIYQNYLKTKNENG